MRADHLSASAGGSSPLIVAGVERRRRGLTESPAEGAPEMFHEQSARLRRAREGRLRSLWQMTAAERAAAMRRGDLSHERLAAWPARYPEEVPIVNGEFEWLIAFTPEACE